MYIWSPSNSYENDTYNSITENIFFSSWASSAMRGGLKNMGGRMDGLEQSQLPRKDLSQECKNSV